MDQDIFKQINLEPCDPEAISKEVRQILEDFQEEVIDTFNEISAKSLGSFITTMYALVSQMAQGAAVNFLSFVGSSLTGNIIGGATTMMGLGVSLVTGSQIMLKYLAADQLRISLERRIELSEALLDDMYNVIRLLQALENIDEDTGQILLYSVENSYPYVRSATRRIGTEYSKIRSINTLEFTDQPLNTANIKEARKDVDKAMQNLIGDNVINPAFKKTLKRINSKYKLQASADLGEEIISASIPDPLAILKYFKSASEEIADNNTEDGEITPIGRDLLRKFLIDFVQTPGLNQYFKNYASMRFLGSHMKSLGIHLPISTVVMKDFAQKGITKTLKIGQALDPLNKFKEKAKGTLDDVFSYLEIDSFKGKVDYPSDNINLAAESSKVKAAESAVLLNKQWLQTVNFQVGGLKLFLKPALNNLRTVEAEMKKTLESSEEYDSPSEKKELTSTKMDWMGRLGTVKTLISSSIEAPVQFGGAGNSTPYDINRQFNESLELYTRLETHILNRAVREDGEGGFEEIPRESDRILDKAESQLKSFVLGNLNIFSENKRSSLLAQMQSMKQLLRSQLKKDKEELNATRLFLDSVDDNPLFRGVIKPSWDAMMQGLKTSALGQTIYNDLANGDMSSLVNSIANASYGVDRLMQVFNCSDESKTFDSEIAKIISGGNSQKLQNIKQLVKEADERITDLKNKRTVIDQTLDALT